MSADVSDPRDDRDSQFVLVVDLGTGGPKVGFASLLGRVVHQEHHEVETTFTADGGATQDAEEWWRLIGGDRVDRTRRSA